MLPPVWSDFERLRRMPPGDRQAARKRNLAGLAARRRGDHAAARAAYEAALAADPSYVWARYNLACEDALQGDRAAAVARLLQLHQMAVPEARRALAKVARDPDFASIRDDPTVAALLQTYAPNTGRLLARQLCAAPYRALALVHPRAGVVWLDGAAEPRGSTGATPPVPTIQRRKGRRADDAAIALFAEGGPWCRRGQPNGLYPDVVLDAAGAEDRVCLTVAFEYGAIVCFVRLGQPPRWYLAVAGRWESALDEAASAAASRRLDEAIARFRQAAR